MTEKLIINADSNTKPTTWLVDALNDLKMSGQFSDAAQVIEDICLQRRDWELLSTMLGVVEASYMVGDLISCERIAVTLSHTFRENCHAYRWLAKIYAEKGDLEGVKRFLDECPIQDSNANVNLSTVYSSVELEIFKKSSLVPLEFTPPHRGKIIQNGFILTMIRDEGDIISYFLNHYYVLGFRYFVVILNACQDNTSHDLNSFKKSHDDVIVVTIVDDVVAYYQAEKTQTACDFALSYFKAIRKPMQWCFVFDGDEFLRVASDLAIADLLDELDTQGTSVIVLHLCNATNRRGLDFHYGQDVYTFFDAIDDGRGRIVTKNAFSVSVEPKIQMGNHHLFLPKISRALFRPGIDLGLYIVHLPCRSRAQFERKVVNGGAAIKNTLLQPHLGAHWRDLYEQFLQSGASLIDAEFEKYVQRTLNDASALKHFALRF